MILHTMKVQVRENIGDYPFEQVFNIKFNHSFYDDVYMPNSLCNVNPLYEVCNDTCGFNCETQHHRGWGRGLAVLEQYYTASSNPRTITLGITATGLCYMSGNVHGAAGGLAQVGGQYSIINKPNDPSWVGIGSIRRQQHEISHLFSLIHDDGIHCTPNQRCIMNSGMDKVIYDKVGDIWCDSCRQKMKNFIETNW